MMTTIEFLKLAKLAIPKLDSHDLQKLNFAITIELQERDISSTKIENTDYE